MIKKLLFLTFMLVLLNANAQNPYAKFGNDAPVIKTTQEKIIDLNKLTVFNNDTTAIAQAIQFDFKNGKIFVFNAKNNLIATKNISKQLLYRWLTIDPKHQYHSPYLGMGNDPINGIDPDGGYKTWIGAVRGWIAGGFQGRISHPGGEGDRDWAVQRSKTGIIGTLPNLDEVILFNDFGNSLWNTRMVRNLTGDSFSISYGGGVGIFVEGEIQSEFTWLLRGKGASFLPYINIFNTGGVSVGTGGEATVTIDVSKGFFHGDLEDLDGQTLVGTQAYVNVGAAVLGGVELEVSQTFNLSTKGTFTNTWTEVSGGIVLGGRASPITAVDVQVGARVNVNRIHFTKGFFTILE